MRFYKILWKLTKATIFYNIFLVKSLTFVLFRSITKYYRHLVISYCDKQNFSVCYCTILPLDDIGKYFTIIKWKVIFPISQILSQYKDTQHNDGHCRDTHYNDIQHNDSQCKDTQHNNKNNETVSENDTHHSMSLCWVLRFFIVMLSFRNAECRYAESCGLYL